MTLHRLLCWLGLHDWIRYKNPYVETKRTHDLCNVCGRAVKREKGKR